MFVRKYNPTGGIAWTTQLAAPKQSDYALSITVNSAGTELYVVGTTDGLVNGENQGENDAFVIRFNGQGKKVWSH